MLPLLHLHHIWSSTSGPHLYSVVSKLGSLDALGGINTRTHCRFKSAQSHEVDPAYREEKTKTVLKIHVYERNNFTFLQKKQLFLLFFFWIHKYSTGFKSRLEETGLRVWENFSAKSYGGKVFQYMACLSKPIVIKLFLPGSTLPRPQRKEPCPKQSPAQFEESKIKLTTCRFDLPVCYWLWPISNQVKIITKGFKPVL